MRNFVSSSFSHIGIKIFKGISSDWSSTTSSTGVTELSDAFKVCGELSVASFTSLKLSGGVAITVGSFSVTYGANLALMEDVGMGEGLGDSTLVVA